MPAPEVLAALLYAASKRVDGGLWNLFSRARSDRELAVYVARWLEMCGLKLHDGLPPGTGFDLVGYDKGMLSGVRVVAVAVKNDASQSDPALERMGAFMRYTQTAHLACTPAAAAEYVTAHAEATGHWDGEALTRRLQALGVGLLLVEGDAIAQALLPKTRPADPKALEALMVAAASK